MNLKVSDAKREDGFTLIELLVVVIIIGILAAIAIPVFLNQRERAQDSAVQQTLRSGATYMEIVFTETNAYPDGAAGLTLMEDQGFRSGESVVFEDPTLTVVDGDFDSYCLEAAHEADVDRNWILDSDIGGPQLVGEDGVTAC